MNTLSRLIYGVSGCALALSLTLHCNQDGGGGGNADMRQNGDGGTNSGGDGGNNPGGDGGSNPGGGDGGANSDGGNNPGGDGGSNPGTPVLTAVSPALGPTTGGTTLTLSGANFPANAQVFIDGLQATLQGAATASQIKVTLPPDPKKKGKVLVEIRQPGVGTVASSGSLFAYYYGQLTFGTPKAADVGVAAGAMRPIAVALADLDKNNKLDAVVINSMSSSVSILYGDGTGTLATMSARGPYAINAQPAGLAVADFDNDGYTDVVTVNPAAESVTVLLNDKSGGLGLPVKQSLAAGTSPQAVAAGKFNSDGFADATTANAGATANSASVLTGAGGGTFNAQPDLSSDQSPSDVAVADA